MSTDEAQLRERLVGAKRRSASVAAAPPARPPAAAGPRAASPQCRSLSALVASQVGANAAGCYHELLRAESRLASELTARAAAFEHELRFAGGATGVHSPTPRTRLVRLFVGSSLEPAPAPQVAGAPPAQPSVAWTVKVWAKRIQDPPAATPPTEAAVAQQQLSDNGGGEGEGG
ncbi:Hypothetical protein EMIHUDRAFT_122862, partial [Emiliania huxleyi CCMP1516]|uniref:Uncharacterized protein n=2 Tax=Emiliania huxleyi TaxID=2903 RepID=A0A0D3KCY1_EMIH1